MSSRRVNDTYKRIMRVLPYVGVVVSLVILAAPALVDRFEAWRAGEHISTLSSTVSALPAGEKERLLNQAQRYNARLAGETVDDGGEGLLPYEQQLTADTSTMMAWLEINSINVRLPIYHGTGKDELAAGVGHLQDSSLPVGGPSTHCALTAHSGMAGSRMFDDIRLLEPGDVFAIWTLGDPLAYEVTGIETVLPDKVDSLRIQQGEDLCTLITCTPYGVNSHRLLVHARRCAYEPEEAASQPKHVSSRDVPLYGHSWPWWQWRCLDSLLAAYVSINKVFCDGVVGAHTAWLLDSYLDQLEYHDNGAVVVLHSDFPASPFFSVPQAIRFGVQRYLPSQGTEVQTDPSQPKHVSS